MQHLGAKQRNVVWSWCAVNDEERKVYLSVWLARPRGIEDTKTGFIFSLELERLPDGTVLGYLKNRIEIR
jgi:hypothetical protein